MPIIRVVVAIAARSAAVTEKVPPVPLTEMDLFPFGRRLTLKPPTSVPENATSLAVIVMLLLEICVETALVTLPVPSVVMFILPLFAVALALTAMVPLEPEEVVSVRVLPVDPAMRVLEIVMLPLAVRDMLPRVVVIAPEVPKLAEAPVVVIDKLVPTVEVPRVTAPAFVISAVAGLPLLTVRMLAAV